MTGNDLNGRLDGALRSLAERTTGRHAPAELEAALRAEYRRARRRSKAWVPGAIAASVLLAASLAAMRPARAPELTAALAAGDAEVGTDFMPVAYGEPFRLEDGGRILRIEMPRMAMVSFGLPVNENRLAERIQAEVLLGNDNLVRAVRFVQ